MCHISLLYAYVICVGYLCIAYIIITYIRAYTFTLTYIHIRTNTPTLIYYSLTYTPTNTHTPMYTLLYTQSGDRHSLSVPARRGARPLSGPEGTEQICVRLVYSIVCSI